MCLVKHVLAAEMAALKARLAEVQRELQQKEVVAKDALACATKLMDDNMALNSKVLLCSSLPWHRCARVVPH